MDNPTGYTETPSTESPVRYMDGSALKRPLSIPYKFRAIMAVFVIAAAVFGGYVLYNVIDDIINAPKREVEATQENLMREVSSDVPALATIIQTDDAGLMTYFNDLGHTLYETTPTEETGGNGFELIKLPSDVTLADAAVLYAKGIPSLTSSEAAKLLKGSWTMSVGRSGHIDMRVKYCDFDSNGVELAVENAVVQQGLSETILGEAGVDSAGNTYQKGQVDVNGFIYDWQVSACPLSEIYSVNGLPTTAAYVVVRMYA